jgi:TPR repeat protein
VARREKATLPGPRPARARAPVPLPEEAAAIPTRKDGLTSGDAARPASVAELERQSEAGDGTAACRLGDHYRAGDFVSQDLAVAFRWYSRGAELGDRCAQNNLGSMFLNGLGCERDPAQAIHWYRKSAEQGHAVAQYNLAKRYLHGDGVDPDYTEAIEWFWKAAVQGEIWASCEMGTMCRFGQGVERNLLVAAEFHLVAAEAGDEVAVLGNIAEYRAELEEMALSGSQLASLFLSRIYNRGFGVDKSQPMTGAWISWAWERCLRDVYTDTAQEVGKAYDFYHMGITWENRREGQRLLKDLRAAHAKRTVESGRAKEGGTRRHRPRKQR